jgi:hypothetical protein
MGRYPGGRRQGVRPRTQRPGRRWPRATTPRRPPACWVCAPGSIVPASTMRSRASTPPSPRARPTRSTTATGWISTLSARHSRSTAACARASQWAFGALIRLPADAGGPDWVLSCSPELFLRHHDGVLQARPMKGTAARCGDAALDALAARRLAADAKNRAENLMIVDLLRNDLGRVARTGSGPRAGKLFARSKRYPTVLQMTSTVEAELAPGDPLPRAAARAVSLRLHHRRAQAPHHAASSLQSGDRAARPLHRQHRLDRAADTSRPNPARQRRPAATSACRSPSAR